MTFGAQDWTIGVRVQWEAGRLRSETVKMGVMSWV